MPLRSQRVAGYPQAAECWCLSNDDETTFRCFWWNKFFTSTIIACYNFFSTTIFTPNCDISLCLFLNNSVGTIQQLVETPWLTLRTESEVCLCKLRKFLKKNNASSDSQEQQEPKWASRHHGMPHWWTCLSLLSYNRCMGFGPHLFQCF